MLSAGPAAGAALPALLDASPFSRVSVASPASAGVAEGGGLLSLDSWEDILLALAILALLALGRSRGELRQWRPRMPSRGA